MKKNSASQSGIFNLRVITACTLFFAAILLAYVGFAGPMSQVNATASALNASPGVAIEWQDKVDPSVLAAAALGQTEFFVHMAQQADLSGAYALETKVEKGQYVYQQMTSLAEATQPPVRQALQLAGAEYKAFWVSNSIWARGNLAALQAVAILSEVAYVYPVGKGGLKLPPQASAHQSDAPSSPNLVEADPNPEPGLVKVNADDVWAMGYAGHGAVVAGADTGVRWTHAALKSNYRGWDGTAASHDYNWHDGIHAQDPANPCPAVPPAAPGSPQPSSPQPCDDDAVLGGGHGSHTVGTMAGDDDATNRIGMAPEAKWIACRNMNQGVGVATTYMECMEWFIAPTKIDGTSPDPSKAPHVINNSWGCVEGCPPPALRMTLQASRAAGIFYAVSAGNDGVVSCGSIYHPLARYPEAFTVGSTTHTTDTISSFSSRGPTGGEPDAPVQIKPNISAPGSTIRSAQRANDTAYANLSGTSMAGPHVAGLVALIISANPALAGKVDRIEDIIEETAVRKFAFFPFCGTDNETSVPNNVYGWGRIDALAAVTLALAEATPVPLVGVASRKTHGDPGTDFDINLPLTDPIGIECRAAQPASGNHKIVFTFLNPISNVGGAAVTSGTGSVSSRGVGANPREYIVDLSGVSNAQRVGVTLSGITDNAGNSTPALSVILGVLLGDVNGDTNAGGVVSNADVGAVKAQVSTTVSQSNFRHDVNLNRTLSNGDVGDTKAQVGSKLP